MKIDIELKHGEINKLEASLGTFRRIFKERSLDAAERLAGDIMGESTLEVPIDTTTLQSSTFIDREEDQVVFGYGGSADQLNWKSGKSASEYMLAVHERTDVRHTVGKAKFLEDPINRYKPRIESLLGRLTNFFIGKG